MKDKEVKLEEIEDSDTLGGGNPKAEIRKQEKKS
jgi:hypothetical protein